MLRAQRLKYEMFVRVRNFGVASRDVFPEESAAGKKFEQLAGQVKVIEEQLVRQGQARAEARKIKLITRKTARDYLKAVASAGRRAAIDEVGPHPFRLPERRAATVVLATARLFMEEAEERKEKFAELGLPPAFLTDFAKAVDNLAEAVTKQQDSRAARHKARGTIDAAVDRGMKIVGDLDVTVPASLRADLGRLSEWFGARRMDQPGDANPDTPPVNTSNPAGPVENPPTGAASGPLPTPAPKAAA